jgi:hypothetical protein
MTTALNGWEIVHLTDRSIELRKDTPAYRRVIDRPAYVLMRGEPGMERAQLIDKAFAIAERNDAKLADIMARQMMPSLYRVAAHQQKQVRLKRAFATPEDTDVIGRKRA